MDSMEYLPASGQAQPPPAATRMGMVCASRSKPGIAPAGVPRLPTYNRRRPDTLGLSLSSLL